MDEPYQGAPDVHVLPTSLTLPGVGVLAINAYVLLAEEPVLIDSGIHAESADFMDALSSVVDPAALRWVWLTHDDADHTGSVQRVFEVAPKARLVTHGFSALRMSTWWPVPFDRVHAIRNGDEIPVGDRTLVATVPPLYDNPMSIGLLDSSTGSFFSADSFGAILPEPTQNIAEVPEEALAGGMMGWAVSDTPWAHTFDTELFGRALDAVRRLQPSSIFSSHLPAAPGSSLESFTRLLEGLPAAEPFVPPDHEQFQQMIAAMMAGPPQQPGAPT